MSPVQIFIINCHCKICILVFVQNRETLTQSCSIWCPVYYGSIDYLRNRDREMLTIKVDISNINFNLLFLKSYFHPPYKQDIKYNFLLLTKCQCFLFKCKLPEWLFSKKKKGIISEKFFF